jgi:hypothetical protein
VPAFDFQVAHTVILVVQVHYHIVEDQTLPIQARGIETQRLVFSAFPAHMHSVAIVQSKEQVL